MKNFKKLFSIVAIVAMLGTAVPTATLGAASYSDELQGAYDYAATNGITTAASIDTANMYGSLTRVAMAKMMANYAIEVKGMTPDTTKSCTFSDVSTALDAQYDNGVTKACQLGIMGVNVTKFNPNGLVTRAQFGTVLSRILNPDLEDGTPNYYSTHLDALKTAGIMKDISKPNATEQRGLVMLMVQRAEEGTSTPAVCTTPENTLSCSLGLDTCPAECKTVQEAKAGTLSVSTTAPDYTSIPAVGAVKHATVSFKAGSEDVSLYSVEMKKVSLATLDGATKMYFEKNGLRVTSKATFSENKATLSFNTALVVKAGSTEKLDLYMYASGTAGDEFQFSSTNINSSALDVNGTINTPLLKAVNYSVAGLSITDASAAYGYKVDGSKLVELGQFTLGSFTHQDTKNLIFKSITLNQKENASLSNLTDLGLYRDEVKVSTDTIVNGRDVSFVLNDTIKYTSSSAVYVVKGKIANAERIGDKYQFQIKYPENTDIIEDTTSFRATITNGSTAFPLGIMTINGADLKFNQLATSYTKQVVPGAKEVVFYTGTVNSVGTVTLSNLTLTGTTTLSGLSDIVRTFYVKIGNTVLSTSASSSATAAVQFEGSVTINGTVPFVVYADIKDTAPATTIKFLDTISLTSFKGTNEYSNGETISSSVGSLSPITISVVSANLQFSNTTTSVKNVQKGDNDITLASLELSTTTDVVSKLYSFKATPAGTSGANFQGGVVTVYDANGNALVSDNITSSLTDLTFVLPTPLAISKGNPVDLTVKLDKVANSVNSGDTMTLTFKTLNAKNIITSTSVTPTPTTLASAQMKVVSAGTVNVVAQTFTPKLVKLDGNVATIGTLQFKPYNGDAKLKKLNITVAAGLTPFTKVVLKDGTTEVATFIKSGSTDLYAENMDKILTVDVTKTYNVVATLKNASTASDLGSATTLSLVQADFESMNGTAISAATLPATVSSAMTFVKAKPLITYVGMNQGGTKAYYKFSVTASGGDMTITGLNFSLTNNTDTASGGTVTLWLDNEGGTQLQTGLQDANIGTADTFTFSSFASTVTVNNGETKTFVLVMPITTWMKSTAAGNVNVELTNMTYVDTFSDSTVAGHANVLTNFLWDIAPAGLSVSLK